MIRRFGLLRKPINFSVNTGSNYMDIEESIETIEAGYEFLLAYAAQGRPASDETDGPGPHARPTIQKMVDAMALIIGNFSASKDSFETWEVNKNFKVILSYNNSPLYAMAVIELANHIDKDIKKLG